MKKNIQHSALTLTVRKYAWKAGAFFALGGFLMLLLAGRVYADDMDASRQTDLASEPVTSAAINSDAAAPDPTASVTADSDKSTADPAASDPSASDSSASGSSASGSLTDVSVTSASQTSDPVSVPSGSDTEIPTSHVSDSSASVSKDSDTVSSDAPVSGKASPVSVSEADASALKANQNALLGEGTGDSSDNGNNDITTDTSLKVPDGKTSITSHKNGTSETVVSGKEDSFTNEGTKTVTNPDGTTTSTSIEVSAIQEAVTAALKKVTAKSTSLTIAVEDGTYNGNVSIAKSALTEGVSLNNSFRLYILAKDSYSLDENGNPVITSASAGGANVNGNISIDGINVTLAGLYLSLNKTLTIKGSDTDVYGSNKADTIAAVLDGKSSLDIYGGNGDDSLSVSGSGSDGRRSHPPCGFHPGGHRGRREEG